MTTVPLTTPPPADHWSDARLAARDELAEDVLGPARRRHWYRSAVVVVAQLAVVLAVLAGSWALDDPSRDDLPMRWAPSWAGLVLVCLGVAVQLVGSMRRSRRTSDLPSTPADAVLPADGRRWVRTQVRSGAPVATERRAVVLDRARRLAASANQVFGMLGFVVIMLGLVVMSPRPPFIGAAALLTAYAVAIAVRDLVRARRARRWLAQHA